MRFFSTILFFSFFSLSLSYGQSEAYAASINIDDLHKHLQILTADSLTGRETGSEGNQKAANYIARHFEQLGIPKQDNGTYMQPIVFSSESFSENEVIINDINYAPMWDYYNFPMYNQTLSTEEDGIVFLGYGIESEHYNDYAKTDVKNKIILIYDGEPLREDSISWITGTQIPSEWTTDITKKITTAKIHGVKAIFIIDGHLQKNISRYRNTYLSTSFQIGKAKSEDGIFSNCTYISTTMARAIIGSNYQKIINLHKRIVKKGKPQALKLSVKLNTKQTKHIKELKGSNVLAYIEGTDPKLKEELVIVTAHFDHLGVRGKDIYRGADDDASGTSAVLEIAEALVQAKKNGSVLRRSVLCMLVTGEEKGLLGSSYYTSFPIYPLENTIANINIDMVGRIDKEHKNNHDYIYVIGADKLSQELHDINETMNKRYTNLELDYKYNDEKDPNRYYYRSDHYNFARNGIPAIFYFNGTHEDYHRTTDTIEKIDFEALLKRTKLAFYTTWELANREKRIILKSR